MHHFAAKWRDWECVCEREREREKE